MMGLPVTNLKSLMVKTEEWESGKWRPGLHYKSDPILCCYHDDLSTLHALAGSQTSSQIPSLRLINIECKNYFKRN